MGYKVSAAVWDYSQQVDSRRLLMLAIADACNNDDFRGYPGVETLARMTCKKARAVRYALADLTKTPELVIFPGAGPRGANVYAIPILPNEPGYTPEECHEPHKCCGYHHPLPDAGAKSIRGTGRGATAIAAPTSKKHAIHTGGATAIAGGGATAIAGGGATAIAPEPLSNSHIRSLKGMGRPPQKQNGALAEAEESAEADPTTPPPPPPPRYHEWAAEYRRKNLGGDVRTSRLITLYRETFGVTPEERRELYG